MASCCANAAVPSSPLPLFCCPFLLLPGRPGTTQWGGHRQAHRLRLVGRVPAQRTYRAVQVGSVVGSIASRREGKRPMWVCGTARLRSKQSSHRRRGTRLVVHCLGPLRAVRICIMPVIKPSAAAQGSGSVGTIPRPGSRMAGRQVAW